MFSLVVRFLRTPASAPHLPKASCPNCHVLRSVHTTPARGAMDIPSKITDTWKSKKRQFVEQEAELAKYAKFFQDSNNRGEEKTRERFHNAIATFLVNNNRRIGHVEFILAALRLMKEFGVHKDLDAYKKLIDIFPKGKMVPENVYQSEFWHYPKHQDCCVQVLDEMEYNAVCPDKELYEMVRNVFGEWTMASKKMKRQLYWMPKFKNANPYPIPRPLPDELLEIARIGLARMSRDPAHSITTWFTEQLVDPSEKIWIVSSQSPLQMNHIAKHKLDSPLYVDGPFTVWVGEQIMSYFLLVADADPRKNFKDLDTPNDCRVPDAEDDSWTATWQTQFNSEMPKSRRRELIQRPTMHEQPDGTIMALAMTKSSTKDSLAMWVDFLQKDNPRLGQLPIIFRMKHAARGALVTQDGTYQRAPEPKLDYVRPPVDLRTIPDS